MLREERYELATGKLREEKSRVVFTDLRGSTLATASYKPGTKAPPVVVSEAVYDPWGRLLEREGTKPDPLHAFVGHEPDPGTGLYQFGARVYDPTLRRWLSPDPLVVALPEIDEHWGIQLNTYGYAGNDPVRNTDRAGSIIESKTDARTVAKTSAELEGGTGVVWFQDKNTGIWKSTGIVSDPEVAATAQAASIANLSASSIVYRISFVELTRGEGPPVPKDTGRYQEGRNVSININTKEIQTYRDAGYVIPPGAILSHEASGDAAKEEGREPVPGQSNRDENATRRAQGAPERTQPHPGNHPNEREKTNSDPNQPGPICDPLDGFPPDEIKSLQPGYKQQIYFPPDVVQ